MSYKFTTFFAGFLVGIGIIFFMHRFLGTQFYLRRLYATIQVAFHLHIRVDANRA